MLLGTRQGKCLLASFALALALRAPVPPSLAPAARRSHLRGRVPAANGDSAKALERRKHRPPPVIRRPPSPRIGTQRRGTQGVEAPLKNQPLKTQPVLHPDALAACARALAAAKRAAARSEYVAATAGACAGLHRLNRNASELQPYQGPTTAAARSQHEEARRALVRDCNQLLRTLGDAGHISGAKHVFDAMVATPLQRYQAAMRRQTPLLLLDLTQFELR